MQGSPNFYNIKIHITCVYYNKSIQTLDEEQNLRKLGRIAYSLDTGQLIRTLKCLNLNFYLEL